MCPPRAAPCPPGFAGDVADVDCMGTPFPPEAAPTSACTEAFEARARCWLACAAAALRTASIGPRGWSQLGVWMFQRMFEVK